MNPMKIFLFSILLLTVTASFCSSARPESTGGRPYSAELKHSKGKPSDQSNKGGGNDGGAGGGAGGFFGPGGGFGIPGFGKGGFGSGIAGGYGGGYGGPNGGYAKGGVVRPTVVCQEKGPCYQKKLTCPAKCFTSYSRAGKGYGGGGGGGGCTMDCKKNCVAYC